MDKRNLNKYILVVVTLTLSFFWVANKFGFVAIGAPFYRDLALESIKLEDSKTLSLREGKFFENGEEVKWGEEKKKAMRLALFYQWAKEDPLLFSPDLNTKEFKKSIDLLEAGEQDFLKYFGWKEERIYPIDFLRSFGEASAAYQVFARDLNEKNAASLLSRIKEARENYAKDVKYLNEVMSRQVSEGRVTKDIKYAALGGETYAPHGMILGDLALMEKNSENLAEEILAREKCLNRSAGYCQRPLLNSSKPADKSTSPADPFLLSKAQINLPKKGGIYGPYEVNSLCWRGNDKNYLYLSNTCPGFLNYCLQLSVLATDTYFVKLFEQNPEEKRLMNLGVQVIPQSATTPYACNNLEYQPALAAIDNFVKKYGSGPIFANLKGEAEVRGKKDFQEILEKGEEAEKDFFSARFPSEEGLGKLAEYYSYLYRTLVENKILSQERQKILERLWVARGRTADFGLISNRVLAHLLNFKNFYMEDKEKVRPDFIYPVRTNYSLFFLNFSSFVWRMSERPAYLISNTDEESLRYDAIINYSSAADKYGEEKLRKWKDMSNKGKWFEFYEL